MLRRIITRNYWVATSSKPFDQVKQLVSKLEDTHKSISKILSSPSPLTYSEKKELINQVKKLDEDIVTIKKISETNKNLIKYI